MCLTAAVVRFQAYTWGQVACRRSEVLGGGLLLTRGSEPPFQRGRAQALTGPLATTGHPSLPKCFSNSLPWLPGKQNPAHSCRGRRERPGSRCQKSCSANFPGSWSLSSPNIRLSFLFIKGPYFASRKQALVSKGVCFMPRHNAPKHLSWSQKCLSLHREVV